MNGRHRDNKRDAIRCSTKSTSGVSCDSQQIAPKTLGDGEIDQHKRNGNMTVGYSPGLPKPPHRPIKVVNPPRRRGKLVEWTVELEREEMLTNYTVASRPYQTAQRVGPMRYHICEGTGKTIPRCET